MNLKYFGTDGIRGPVGGAHINPQFAERVGKAVGIFIREKYPEEALRVVVGRDTRESGKMLEEALITGLVSLGIDVDCLGIVPTPAVSYNVSVLGAKMGIIITASHNPATDNGIKLLDAKGRKLSHVEEEQLEELIEREGDVENFKEKGVVKESDGQSRYIEFLNTVLPAGCLAGWKVVLDTANGSTVATSPEVLKYLGAEVVLRGNTPDGKNINDGVGSEFPKGLAKAVKDSGARLGIAHDGDGDRLLVCDEEGAVVPGDQLLGVLGLYALREGKLKEKILVATIQSNMGLDKALRLAGGKVIRVDVGDRNVLHKMEALGCNVGGESSGHIIFHDYINTGDALLSALKVFEVMLKEGKALKDLRREVELFPQTTESLKVREKRPWLELVALEQVIADLEGEMGDRGRVLVRYSGTEPKIRLLVEGESADLINEGMGRLKEAVRKDLEVIT